jgi:deoxyribonuclease I
MNRLSRQFPLLRVSALIVPLLGMLAIACGPEQPEPQSYNEPDTGYVPPKPMGGGSDAGLMQGDPCTLWSGTPDQRLLTELHQQLSTQYRPIEVMNDLGGNPNRYTTARKFMFTRVERFRSPEGPMVVECVYTTATAPAPETEDPNRDLINCEHVMPRSRMVDKNDLPGLYSHMQSDIHNLLPSTPEANSARGSFPFGEVVSDRNLDFAPSTIGRGRNGDTVFEPRRERRGDIARTVLYASVRWGIDVGADEEEALRRWNQDDPPDNRERARNDAVQGIQGNRNPFIDCHDLVDRIDDFRFFQIQDSEQSLPNP